jgi:hypothetical protein
MTGVCSDIRAFSFGARLISPYIHIIVDVCKRQNVSFSLYLAQRRGVNYGFAGSVPIWNPEGMFIFHIVVDISEAGISLRLSYIRLAISEFVET